MKKNQGLCLKHLNIALYNLFFMTNIKFLEICILY